jgi:hypothetical protein
MQTAREEKLFISLSEQILAAAKLSALARTDRKPAVTGYFRENVPRMTLQCPGKEQKNV